MKYSAKKAAEVVGKSVPTITRAIKSGRLSAEKKAGGGYMIDPSELFRVYPSKDNVTSKMLPSETPQKVEEGNNVTPKMSSEIKLLRDQIARIDEMNARERERLEEQIEDLRRERDNWHALAEKQADTVKLLTHQQDEAQKKAAEEAQEPAFRVFGIPFGKNKKQA